MCGTYVFEFRTESEASNFIERFRRCPIWPIVTRGLQGNQVFILALELRRQAHGDFSQEHNTLVKNPHYLGARVVRFRRDDSLIALFEGHELRTGVSDSIPCGSNCENCASYQDPCQGCPACYEYAP
jgi:hypothetical protein